MPSFAPFDLEDHLRTLGVDGATLGQTAGTREAGRDTPPAERTLTPRPSQEPAVVSPLPRLSVGDEAPGVDPASASESLHDLQIIGLLGEGGMGRVDLARQRSLDREVAIKSLKTGEMEPRQARRLLEEATTLGRLEHPNIVPVHAVGIDGQGRLRLVMKRIDGVSWRDLLHDPSHPRWDALVPAGTEPGDAGRLDAHLEVMLELCRALHFAHGRGVVHRDVKPENVLIGAHGEVYLADFGVALRIGRGPASELVGTPAYMAPEMVAGATAAIDARTDVFLLGATLHEVLTGAPPYRGETVMEVLLAAHEGLTAEYGEEVPAEVAALARRAMAHRPEDRFPSALAFRDALLGLRQHRGSIALTHSARALLDGLRAGDTEGFEQRLTECRFAFVQALREWPDNLDARAGLDACLHLAAGREVRRGQPGAARALLTEASTPNPEVEQALAALSAQLEAERVETERLRSKEAEGDLRVGFAARFGTYSPLLVLTVAGSLYLQLGAGADAQADAARDAVVHAGLLAAGMVGALVLFRRPLLANAAGRRVTLFTCILAGGFFMHRAVAYRFGVPVEAMLPMDLVFLSGTVATSSLIAPRLGWAAVPGVLGVLASMAFPAHVRTLFAVADVTEVLALTGLWLLELRSQATPDRAP